METLFHSTFRDARRRFLRVTAGTTLSAAGIAVVSGIGARAG